MNHKLWVVQGGFDGKVTCRSLSKTKGMIQMGTIDIGRYPDAVREIFGVVSGTPSIKESIFMWSEIHNALTVYHKRYMLYHDGFSDIVFYTFSIISFGSNPIGCKLALNQPTLKNYFLG